MFERVNIAGLLDHQCGALADLVRLQERLRVTLDASDVGTGKTFVGGALIRHFDEPTLVVCPKSVIPSWERAGEHLGVEFNVINYEMLRTGRTPFVTKKPVEFVMEDGTKRKYNRFEWAPEVKFVLFDEAHRFNGQTSDQSKLLIRAKAQGKRIHMMTATPAESPLKMKAMGYALGLFNSPSAWWNWCRGRGCKKGYFGGLQFGGTAAQRVAVMQSLNALLFPHRGIRLRVSELPGFPEVARSVDAIGLPMKDSEKITALYEEMKQELQAIDAKGLGENEAIRLTRQRQTVEMLKIPSLLEMIEDGMAQGMAVAVFVNFRDTISALAARLQTSCIIWGEQPPDERERNRKAFQDNDSRVILCTDAGREGIDLHDIHGKYPVLALINPGWSATSFKQVLGRTHRSGAKSKAIQRILFADKTPEMKVFRKLKGKVDNLDALCDAYGESVLEILK
jgi:superfamily II DNA or RNA helicase